MKEKLEKENEEIQATLTNLKESHSVEITSLVNEKEKILFDFS